MRLRWAHRAQTDLNALDLLEADLIVAAVIEAGGAGALVVGHLLGDLELAAVLEVFGDAGGAKGVVADPGEDAVQLRLIGQLQG